MRVNVLLGDDQIRRPRLVDGAGPGGGGEDGGGEGRVAQLRRVVQRAAPLAVRLR